MIGLSLCLIFGGIVLVVKFRSKPWAIIGGIALILGGWWSMGSLFEVSHEVIGIETINESFSELEVEFRFFELKQEAIRYYEDKGVKRFYLAAKFNESTREFYQLLGHKKKIFRMKFFSEGKKSALDKLSDFYFRYELMPVYNSLEKK